MDYNSRYTFDIYQYAANGGNTDPQDMQGLMQDTKRRKSDVVKEEVKDPVEELKLLVAELSKSSFGLKPEPPMPRPGAPEAPMSRPSSLDMWEKALADYKGLSPFERATLESVSPSLQMRQEKGITQSLTKPYEKPDVMVEELAPAPVAEEPATTGGGLMSKPDLMDDAKADRTAAALPSDDIVRASIVKNSNGDSLSESSIVSQVKDLVGQNMKAAAILGAFSKESGSNFDDLTESNAYSLKSAYSSWKDSDVNSVLNTLDPAVKARLQKDFKAGISTGGAASLEDRRLLGDAMFDAKYEGGSKYKGRGLIHITHKSNYKAVGDRIGVDLVENPELINDPKYAVPAALAYLDLKGFFKADSDVTKDSLHRTVNPWAGDAVKEARWKAAKAYLSEWQEEVPTNTPAPQSRPNQEEE